MEVEECGLILHISANKLALSFRNSNGSRPNAVVTIYSNELVAVLRSELHTKVAPSIEMASNIDTTVDFSMLLLRVTNGPELLLTNEISMYEKLDIAEPDMGKSH